MSASDSTASVCLIKPGHKVYQWSLQQILEFVVSLQRALGLNTLDTPIHCMHILSELSQIIPQLVNIISGFFPRNPSLVYVEIIQSNQEITSGIAVIIIRSIEILKWIH